MTTKPETAAAYGGLSVAGEDKTAFLDVRELRVQFPTDDGLVKAVDGISFKLERGRTLGIVGESGSGKSVTSLGIMGLHSGRGSGKVSGQVYLDGQELIGAPPDEVRKLRGNKMAMIFQDPLSSMHPFYPVGKQIIEAYRVHVDVSKREARTRAIEMLRRVGIPQPEKRIDDYPHQFSGGMRQRAMIAMALVCNPDLLIADEPTTALDVTVQAQILDLIRDLQEEFGSAVIMITHDLGVVAELADDILVMYGGRCVEYGSVETLFRDPEHPYSWGLLGSMPRLDRVVRDRLMPIKGTPPSLIHMPPGCSFHPSCAYALTDGIPCRTEAPLLEPAESANVATALRSTAASAHGDAPARSATGSGEHSVACHMPSMKRREIFHSDIAPNL